MKVIAVCRGGRNEGMREEKSEAELGRREGETGNRRVKLQQVRGTCREGTGGEETNARKSKRKVETVKDGNRAELEIWKVDSEQKKQKK